MKKILAVLLALTMVLAFAACGGKTEEPSEADTTAAVVADDTTAAPAEESTEAAPVEETEAPAEETTAAPEETTAEATKGLNSTDVAEVIAFYNAAVKATQDAGAPKGKQTMKLVDGSLDGDGAIGAIVKVLEPIAVKALEKNSTSTDYIPGHENDLLATDASAATATSKNGVTTIKITLKSQTDGPDADAHNAGPVARGIGTLGSIETALAELGASISKGRDTVKLTYNNAYIECKVNEETGTITGGTWHHLVNINIGDAQAKISVLSANLKNFKGKVDFTVAI